MSGEPDHRNPNLNPNPNPNSWNPKILPPTVQEEAIVPEPDPLRSVALLSVTVAATFSSR